MIPAKPRRGSPLVVAIPVFPGLQSLDAIGPAQVFGSTNQVLSREAYRVVLLASRAGPVETSAGVGLVAKSLRALPARSVDTLICPGGEAGALGAASLDVALARWIRAAATASRRACSVCSGTFLLAATGVLDGRAAATHWSATSALARRFPALRVDAESIYVTDGKCWTSAGVTTGIDMALALVEQDHGREVAMAVAQRLVVYMRRPGHQTQFSPTLRAQSAEDDRLAELASWVEHNLDGPLDVASLAKRAAMSQRSLHRRMREELGVSPAKFVEAVRLDAARRWLDDERSDLAAIAARSGFSGPDQLIRAFSRRFGVTPAVYRRVHAARAANGVT